VALGARVWHGRPRRAQISASHANSLRRLPPAQWGSSSPLPSAPPQLGTRCVPARNTTTTRSRCPPTYPPPAPREQLVPARATSMKLGPPGCTAAAQGLVGPKCSRADAALHSDRSTSTTAPCARRGYGRRRGCPPRSTRRAWRRASTSSSTP
jgi:hypothetical protein